MIRVLVASAVLLAACSSGQAARSFGPSPTVTPGLTPQINVSDMMGAFPPATFFVVNSEGVHALALLNHATKFVIPTSGETQVAAHPDGDRVFIVDQPSEGVRIRWFDSAGVERASRVEPGRRLVRTGGGHATVTADLSSGTLLVLMEGRSSVTVEAFDLWTLRQGGLRLEADICTTRLFTGGGRIATACPPLGRLTILEPSGVRFDVVPGLGPILGAAALGDGTIVFAAERGDVQRLGRDERTPRELDLVRGRGARMLPDGISAYAGCCVALAMSSTTERVGLTTVTGGYMLIEFPESIAPIGGVIVHPPFAYWTTARGEAKHIDIQQGFAETMATSFGSSLRPGDVLDR